MPYGKCALTPASRRTLPHEGKWGSALMSSRISSDFSSRKSVRLWLWMFSSCTASSCGGRGWSISPSGRCGTGALWGQRPWPLATKECAMSIRLFLLLCLFAALCCSTVSSTAAEPPSQFRPLTEDGGINLTHAWLHHGGGRLYWKALMAPRQIVLNGAHFEDPARMPDLFPTPKAHKRRTVRRRARHPRPRAVPQIALQPAPKDVGKTALQPPAAATTTTDAPAVKTETPPPLKPKPVSYRAPRRTRRASTHARAPYGRPPLVTTYTSLR